MSIKILLISNSDNLISLMEKNYKNHIENNLFKIYTPEIIEKQNIKTHYDAIITEEEFLPFITLKNVPIIILNEKENNKNNNYIYIKNNPINWQDLYDLLIRLQYKIDNFNLSLTKAPEVENITYYSNIDHQQSIIIAKDNSITEKKNNFITEKKDNNIINNNDIHINKQKFNSDSFNISLVNSIDQGDIIPEELVSENKLSTKIYNKQDMAKVSKIIQMYGENNHIDEKIIAQASIIFDELLYTIQNFNENDTNNTITINNDPKVLITAEAISNEFNLNIQCLIDSFDVNNVLSLAQDYANTVHSFKRNKNTFINISWYIH